jgi:hypothetical protein
LISIPLSAVIGSAVGLLCGLGIYIVNRRLKKKFRLCIFVVLLLVVLSAGLFTGGCYKVGNEIWDLKKVWTIEGDFWSVNRLPMTVFKPFGYNDSRTVLEIVCFWSWLALSALLHCRKCRRAPRVSSQSSTEVAEVSDGVAITRDSSIMDDVQTVELGEASSIAQSLATARDSTRDDVQSAELGEASSIAQSIATTRGTSTKDDVQTAKLGEASSIAQSLEAMEKS